MYNQDLLVDEYHSSDEHATHLNPSTYYLPTCTCTMIIPSVGLGGLPCSFDVKGQGNEHLDYLPRMGSLPPLMPDAWADLR